MSSNAGTKIHCRSRLTTTYLNSHLNYTCKKICIYKHHLDYIYIIYIPTSNVYCKIELCTDIFHI